MIWIGTSDKGLNKWDRATNKFTHYKHNPNDPNSISDNRVTDIYEDKSGVLWIATYYGGLNKFDRKTEKFYAYRNDPSNPNSIIRRYSNKYCRRPIGKFMDWNT